MMSLTGVVTTWPGRPRWGLFSDPVVELAPDQVLFVLRRTDQALRRVEISAAEPRIVRMERDDHGLVLRRDFGVRLSVPCEFAGSLPGQVEVEARLRVLAGGAEWPLQLPSEAPARIPFAAASSDPVLARLIGGLFAADVARVFAEEPYAGLPLRLHEPALVARVEAAVRAALSRPAEEDVLALRGIELLGVESPLEEERLRDAVLLHQAETRENLQERIDALEQRRLARTMRLKRLEWDAEAEKARLAGTAQEVRWRLFEPADLRSAGARPPTLCRESSDRHATLASGHHVQILVRPSEPSHVYVLSLGPYWTGSGERIEYRWMRLFGNEGATELLQRPPRAGGNRLSQNDLLVFPGDAGASELFQHFLTLDSAPGCEFLVVALTPHPLSEGRLSAALPRHAPEPSFLDRMEVGLREIFGTESRLYTYQFSHS